jgi:thioredoxin reductase (NADPH)
MSANTEYDLIIVGGGPVGISCAITAQSNGLNYIILEKGLIVNSIYNFPTNMTFFSTSQKLEISDIPFIAQNEKPTRAEALEYYRRLVLHFDLNIKLDQEVKAIKKDEAFTVTTQDKILYAKNVVIATGFYDHYNALNVQGEDLAKVRHYYDDAHKYIKKNVLVVGGANSACDVALETWAKGAAVTMVVRGHTLYEKTKYWILPNIENRIKEGSIKAYFNSTVAEITPTSVVINTLDGQVTIANDYVLAMTGYKINYDLLHNAGIAFCDDLYDSPHFDESTFETNVAGLYIAGVVHAGKDTSRLFIENTRHHGEVIVGHIVSRNQNSERVK